MSPDSVELIDDYLDLEAGVGFPAGTVLRRVSTGQYAPPGATLGDDCVSSYAALWQTEHFLTFNLPLGACVRRYVPPRPATIRFR